MTAIQAAISQAERYLEDVDLERDDIVRRVMTLKTAAARGRWGGRLAQLGAERSECLQLLETLRSMEHTPALMFEVRPRMHMAKATMRPLVRATAS